MRLVPLVCGGLLFVILLLLFGFNTGVRVGEARNADRCYAGFEQLADQHAIIAVVTPPADGSGQPGFVPIDPLELGALACNHAAPELRPLDRSLVRSVR